MRFNKGVEWSVIALLSLAAAVGTLLATPLGPGVSPDSTVYLATARGIARGEGWVSPTEADSGVVPMTHYPPLYPLAIALGKPLHLSPLAMARVINALAFASTVVLAGILMEEFSGGEAAAIVAALLVACSASLLQVYTYVYSEPMAIALNLAAAVALARYFKKPLWRHLLRASLFASAGCLTRYGGAAIVVAGAIALLGFSWRRWIGAFVFAAIGIVPMIGWLIRNRLVAGTIASRQVQPHIGSRLQLVSLWHTFSDAVAPTYMKAVFFALIICFVLLVYFGVVRSKGPSLRFGPPPLFILFNLFVAIHLVLVAIVVEPGRPLDVRLLSPIFVPVVVLIVGAVAMLIRRAGCAPVPIAIAAIAVVLTVASNLAAGISATKDARARGVGFDEVRWRKSAVLAMIFKKGRETHILSNSPDGMLFSDSRIGGWRFDDRQSIHVHLLQPDADSIHELLGDGGWICYTPGSPRNCLPQAQLRGLRGIRLKMRDEQGFALYSYRPEVGK